MEYDATTMGGEAPMGGSFSDLLGFGRGSDTPASDEVKRTGLQPQVDAQEIETKQKNDQDKILAIDAGIERLDKEMPEGKNDEDSPKIGKIKSLWQKFKDKWDEIKNTDDGAVSNIDDGLGNHDDDEYAQMMRQHPNMVLAPPQYPAGPGTFGVS